VPLVATYSAYFSFLVADLLLDGGSHDLVARPTSGALWTKAKLPFEVPLFSDSLSRRQIGWARTKYVRRRKEM
jgi:hypothetical protein